MQPGDGEGHGGSGLAALSLAALGVVYGDIGTSPLYALRECFREGGAIHPSAENVMGAVSLIFWALTLIVSVKYLTFILRADNHGEGGVLALTALIMPRAANANRSRMMLIGFGLFAAALLYGDGAITPAISVLSAVEGLEEVQRTLMPYVLPITVGILIALFLIQCRGTAKVGTMFGPIMGVWFIVIGVVGFSAILRQPGVIGALNPMHGLQFLLSNGLGSLPALGAVFLSLTGAEAMYADMGHFGPRPIRVTWFSLALPGLTLCYLGQGAAILADPGAVAHPFYAAAPAWGRMPLIVLATMATVIASQAVISGSFSITRQAVQLGFLPRLQVIHTSAKEIGQIYVPTVNWLLMLATLGLVLGFRTSGGLAAAYGVAVTTTMLITTILFGVLAREKWRWPMPIVCALVALFATVDFVFFTANIAKIANGAWFPIAMALLVYTILSTWRRGRDVMAKRLAERAVSVERFLRQIRQRPPMRVPGTAVYMSGSSTNVPLALTRNLRHNHVLHNTVLFLTIEHETRPHVPDEERVAVKHIESGIYRVTARYGFAESPSVPEVFRLVRRRDLDLKLRETTFFLGREVVLPHGSSGLSHWRQRLFAFLSRNAMSATTFFEIPPEQVVELGAQIEF